MIKKPILVTVPLMSHFFPTSLPLQNKPPPRSLSQVCFWGTQTKALWAERHSSFSLCPWDGHGKHWILRVHPHPVTDSSKFSSVQLLSHVQLLATPWTTAHQASLSITNSWSLLKLMSIKLVMLSNHLIFCCPLLLPSIFPSIRVFSNESALRIRWPKYWKFQLQHQSFQ